MYENGLSIVLMDDATRNKKKQSQIILPKAVCKKAGIIPSWEFFNSTLKCIFEGRPLKLSLKGQIASAVHASDLRVKSLRKIEKESPSLNCMPPQRFESKKHILTLESSTGGGMYSIVPTPYYLFNILLTEKEYEGCKTLLPAVVFSVELSVVTK
jgi:hypothetical protein